MRIILNVKPRIVSGTSKNDILGKLRMGGWTVDGNGSRYSNYADRRGDVSIIGINFEKHRKKVKMLKSGDRKVVTAGHWVAYVYNFKKFAQIVKIKQNNRNFTMSIG